MRLRCSLRSAALRRAVSSRRGSVAGSGGRASSAIRRRSEGPRRAVRARWCTLSREIRRQTMILLYLLVPTAYLFAALFEWQRLAHPTTPQSSANAGKLSRWLAVFALAGHAVLLASAVPTGNGLDLSLANSTWAVGGLVAFSAWSAALAGALPGPAAVALPVAALAVPLPALLPNPHRFSAGDDPWAALHISVAFIAYALLIVAALQAVV